MAPNDNLANYREVLRHIVRPDDTEQRDQSRRIAVQDYVALALQKNLREYAAYESPDAEHEQIALGYIEYIDMTVRREERKAVYLYAHTEKARVVLAQACDVTTVNDNVLPIELVRLKIAAITGE